MQVDVLLSLLGEALVFVNRKPSHLHPSQPNPCCTNTAVSEPNRTLTTPHLYTLLAALEDLATAPSMIRTQCEEVLHTTLSALPKPSLQKSTSNLSAAYSLIGSADFSAAGGYSADGSGVLVQGEEKRGWDWRTGFARGAAGGDVERVLRLGVAREMGRAFAGGV